MRILGIALIVLGLLGLVGGISWTQREKVADLGPIHITSEERHTIPVTPVAGGLSLVAGAALLIAARRKTP